MLTGWKTVVKLIIKTFVRSDLTKTGEVQTPGGGGGGSNNNPNLV